jgi:hypothetical protein
VPSIVIEGGGWAVGLLERDGGGNRRRVVVIWGVMVRFGGGSIFGRVNELMIYVRRVEVKTARWKIVRARGVLGEMPGVVSWSTVHLVVVHIRRCWLVVLVVLDRLNVVGRILLRRSVVGVEGIRPFGAGIVDGQHDGGFEEEVKKMSGLNI